MDCYPYAYVTYSPDDERESGKGHYATLFAKSGDDGEKSPLFDSRAKAISWAKRRGAVVISSTD